MDHGIRVNSDRDAELIKRLATRWGIPLIITRRSVPTWAKRHRMGLEAAGREVRYHWFTRLAINQGASWLATGHTLDDQAETVLMHLIRGTGVSGLGGIPQRRRLAPGCWLGRPLLGVSRADLSEYIKRHQLSYHRDPTNRDRSFFRNRVRYELLPLLERYNPRIKMHLAALASLVQIEERGWEPLVRRSIAKTLRRDGENVILDLTQFFRYDKALASRVLRAVIGPIPYHSVTQLYAWATSPAESGRLRLPGGWVATKTNGRLAFTQRVK